MKFIKIEDCYKTYKNGVTATAGLNLEIDKGEFVFIIGATGCGKSTLIKMLYREEKPTKGKVIVGGIDVAKLRNSKVYKLRRKLGIVFQDFKLLPKLNVYDNVAYPLTSMGLKNKEIKPRVIKALDLVGLKEKMRSYPNELSAGMQQRVCIARAMVNGPKLLICDEPTGNLDPETSKEIMEVLNQINQELGTTIVMVTHDKDIVNRMKKRVILLDNGVLASDEMKGKYKVNESV
mgnify:CR=1 FL=1